MIGTLKNRIGAGQSLYLHRNSQPTAKVRTMSEVMDKDLQAAHASGQKMKMLAAAMLDAAKEGHGAMFDSVTDEADGFGLGALSSRQVDEQGQVIGDGELKAMFDSLGPIEAKEVLAKGVEQGIQRYEQIHGEKPTAAMVGFGIGVGASVYHKHALDHFAGIQGFDDIGNDNHEATAVVPAMTVVTIATAIANSLPIVAMQPNPIGSNTVPLVYLRLTANKKHGALASDEYLDGESAMLPYVENRFEFAATTADQLAYTVTCSASYADYDDMTPDAAAAPFLGGQVAVLVNGVEVANDFARKSSKTSGTHPLIASDDLVLPNGGTVSGLVNLDNHTVTINFTEALNPTDEVTVEFVLDYERTDSSGNPVLQPPGVNFETEYDRITAAPWRSRVTATIDVQTQLANEMSIGFVPVALGMMQQRFYIEQNQRLLKKGKRRAIQNGRVYTFDASRGVTGNLAAAYNKTGDLIAEALKIVALARTDINKTVGASATDFDLFVTDRAAHLFMQMNGDMFSQTGAQIGIHTQIVRIGRLADGTNVYYVPDSARVLNEEPTASEIMLIARSSEAAKSAFVGHVPVPPMVREANPDEFKTQVGVFGRFAARMNPLRRFADQIAVINMTNLPSTGR
jgi:hypothetical protein